jgi:hypothetical protein
MLGWGEIKDEVIVANTQGSEITTVKKRSAVKVPPLVFVALTFRLCVPD